ncbi:MAG: hypothetical protein HYY93_17080, partial [Planctomycetes bacterium]|nr:hypothetical protein [Planctomycetota bacterium]
PPAGRAAPAAHTRPVTVALVSLVVVLFAGFANPYGAEAFVYPFRLMGAEYFRTHIAEWQPPDFSPYLWPFWLLIALAGGALVASSRRRDWAAIGLLLAFGYLALNSRRHLELFCVVSVPIIAAALTPGLARLEGILRLATIPRRRHAAVGLGLAGIALLTGAAWRTDELYRPGWGEHPRAFPVKAMDYALSRPGQGWLAEAQPHVLCDMSWSGYLAWRAPHARYFIDGRNLEFGAERYRLYAVHGQSVRTL